MIVGSASGSGAASASRSLSRGRSRWWSLPWRFLQHSGSMVIKKNFYHYVIEPLHRGIKQRIWPMGGFKRVESAKRFCRLHDEVRNFLRPRSYRNEVVSLAQRRWRSVARTRVLLTSLAAAERDRRVTLLPHLLPVGAISDTTHIPRL